MRLMNTLLSERMVILGSCVLLVRSGMTISLRILAILGAHLALILFLMVSGCLD